MTALSKVLVATGAVVFLAPLVFASRHEVKSTAASKAPAVETHHPRGWRFTMPKGDPNRGRTVFEKFECYYCHEVRGEQFPSPVESGPELSQMGPMHPVEFFAESVMNPNAVVPKNYREPDGTTPMTNFAEKMTVQELIDVSTYVASLRPQSKSKAVTGRGKVVAVVSETSKIILAHDAIEGFMDAMTMGYKVGSGALLRTAKPGETVEFTIDTEKRVITKIAKAAPVVGKKQQ